MKTQADMKKQNTESESETSETSVEVVTRPTRRKFTADYKRKVLAELDGCEHGGMGALLRREGLYSSHIETWRRQLEEGLAPKKRGRKPVERNPLQSEVEQLRRQNARLEHRLHQAEIIIAVQKKVSEMLGLPASEEQS